MVSLRALLAVLLLVPPLAAQTPTRIDGLGATYFPNSGAAEAQVPFLRGVLLLHSFEYGPAADAFREAQEIDPDFALAYWGEAMTYTHPVWNRKDVEAGRAALARYAPTAEARAARAPTERERAWLRAVDVLYGEGGKAALDTLYSAAMGELAAAWPDDLEARAFHALSILGLSQGDRDVPRYMEAGAIALDVFEKNPDHPGAAHYVIHAFDDPTHAILAMEAARAYAPMAPDAAHAQHMTSHIFLARGMWDDVVEANVNADAVVDRDRAAAGLPPANCGHYNDWLQYGYLQRGEMDRAVRMQRACASEAVDPARGAQGRMSALVSSGNMRAWHLADLPRSPDEVLVAARPDLLSDAPAIPRMIWLWGDGVAATRVGDAAAARAALTEMQGFTEWSTTSFLAPYVPIWKLTLEAYVLRAEGDLEGAAARARTAAEMEASLPVDFGPPIAFKPARELEADLLFELGRTEEATAAYRSALARTPNRTSALLGLARALPGAEGDAVVEDLDAGLEHADADFHARLWVDGYLYGRSMSSR
jgi:tetratricopeptide (TPR) repeat protein